MVHRSRFLLPLLVGSAAVTAACAHPSLGGPAAPSPVAAAARSPHVVSSRHAVVPPVVRPFASARDGAAIVLAELDGRTVAYVADEDDAVVRVIDVDDGRELSSAHIGGIPGQLALRKDGRLVATVRDAAQVVVLSGGGTEESRLTVDRRIDVAADPVGLALSRDDATLVVDVEYSRVLMGVAQKKGPTGQIYPDLIVHSRGSTDRNLLAVEIKRGVPHRTTTIDRGDDKKLRHLTSTEWMEGQPAYARGAALQLAHDRARLHWYTGGDYEGHEDWAPDAL